MEEIEKKLAPAEVAGFRVQGSENSRGQAP